MSCLPPPTALSVTPLQYVFLAANSTFKADSDLAKYEKARKLKDLIGDIRKNYEAVGEGRAGSVGRCGQSVKVCELRVRIEASGCWRAQGERGLDH